MKKLFIGIVVVLVLAVLALVFGRNMLARSVVINGIKQVCGLDIDIANVDISLPNVSVTGLKVYNPDGFSDKVLADIPEVSFDLDLQEVLKNKIHFKKLKLDVGELNVVLNDRGKLNVNSLALLLPKPGGGKPPEVKIDELIVKIGKVSYKGYLPVVGVKAQEFDPGVNETFRDVTDPKKITAQILQRIVSKVGVGSFANFGVKGGLGQFGDEVKKTVDEAAQGIKGLFNPK